ncbi:VOC family protein [Elstera sp.]|jgi:catechol 2,3-dioxygenase-like lactoylglutathione lyase family enzyme|uniref:VOC family protein n=1 Tax=Elstera sp. TaxID=1916664 RepID=UPI0037C19C98
MGQIIGAIALLVPDYARGLAFFVDTLGFTLIEDTPVAPRKRWVRLRPPGAQETCILLAQADGPRQTARIGDQTGGRVFLFLETDDFARDYARYTATGVTFLEAPRHEPYGTVAVFQDPFGNRWDLIQPT